MLASALALICWKKESAEALNRTLAARLAAWQAWKTNLKVAEELVKLLVRCFSPNEFVRAILKHKYGFISFFEPKKFQGMGIR